MGQRRGGAKRGGRAPSAPVEAHKVRNLPLKRGRGRVACAKQSNADLVQLSLAGVDDRPDPAAETTNALNREARARLARLTERDNSLKSYMKELRKVLEHADVLIEVLDVRDPLGCRAYAIEEEAMRLGKRIILVLNKIDLVPASNVRAWLAYLRQEYPTLPFKASTQQQRHNLGQGPGIVWKSSKSGDDMELAGGAEAAGTRAILQLVKNYSRNLNIKSSITVGTIGAPNVGKSSLINSLKRSRVCGVAATPGHTKVMQGVMLDRHVRLLDSPGIVFSDTNAPPGATPEEVTAAAQAAMLRNVLKVELVDDPMEPVQAILHRVDPKYLAGVYGLPDLPTRDAQDFLLRVAYQKGRLARGAIPDLDGTARSVLHDWNVGKIKYQTEPPARPPTLRHRPKVTAGQDADEGSTAIVSSLGEAFDLAGLLGEADAAALGGDGHYEAPPQPPAEPVAADGPADATDSTLGKRERSESESESEDDGPWARRRPTGNAFAALSMPDDDDDDEEDKPRLPPAKKQPKERPMFTEAEREGMADKRGAARRKLRKEKKRRADHELTSAMDTLMDMDGEAADEAAADSTSEEL